MCVGGTGMEEWTWEEWEVSVIGVHCTQFPNNKNISLGKFFLSPDKVIFWGIGDRTLIGEFCFLWGRRAEEYQPLTQVDPSNIETMEGGRRVGSVWFLFQTTGYSNHRKPAFCNGPFQPMAQVLNFSQWFWGKEVVHQNEHPGHCCSTINQSYISRSPSRDT